jgi:serine/threonine protein kinase
VSLRASPLRPGDPIDLSGYRIRGRLGAGGQGVVYLGESATGERVAIKMLRAASNADEVSRFRRESQLLPKVAYFCTAQVLETGVAGKVPYIVSEYIEGPTLQQAIAERGPLHGARLNDLAVGTITALAAIHRAGVVHRDFKPANVLMARDGLRVIDFGIARQTAGEATGGGPLGTPSYMAPEQLDEDPVGPAADLFAWACTIVFAATGQPPFGGGSVPAILNRVLHADPDLGTLDGDLRDLVAACLAKNPAARPTAGAVLLRLLGRRTDASNGTAGEKELKEGSKVAGQNTPRPRGFGAGSEGEPRRRHALGGRGVAAVAVTASLLVLAALSLLVTRSPERADVRPSPSPSPAPSRSVASAGPLAPATRTVKIPVLGVALYENPTDPWRLTAYIRSGPGLDFRAGLRLPGSDTFQPIEQRLLLQVSPDGTATATAYDLPKYVQQHVNEIRFTDRAGNGEFWVPTVDMPLSIRGMIWSQDSRRVLLTVYDTRDDKEAAKGFVVVDRQARTAAVTMVDDSGAGKRSYAWASDDTAVARGGKGDKIRVYGLDGRLRRTVEGLRVPDGDIPRFSLAGRIAAFCPGKKRAVCVLDVATGKRVATFPLPGKRAIWFWFNADHLTVYDPDTDPPSAVAVDLTGKTVRRLAEFPDTTWTVHWSTG